MIGRATAQRAGDWFSAGLSRSCLTIGCPIAPSDDRDQNKPQQTDAAKHVPKLWHSYLLLISLCEMKG